MKIIDPRVLNSTAIFTVVMCSLFIGYFGAEANHSTQDWILLVSMSVVLVCTLFVMLHDIWKSET